MNEPLFNAILQKLGFRGDETRRYQATVIYTALALHPSEVAADDVPLALRPANSTTAGCVFALLKSDGAKIFNRTGRRASRTKSRHAAWINSYTLTNRRLALAWLAANGFPAPDADQADVRRGQTLLNVA